MLSFMCDGYYWEIRFLFDFFRFEVNLLNGEFFKIVSGDNINIVV